VLYIESLFTAKEKPQLDTTPQVVFVLSIPVKQLLLPTEDLLGIAHGTPRPAHKPCILCPPSDPCPGRITERRIGHDLSLSVATAMLRRVHEHVTSQVRPEIAIGKALRTRDVFDTNGRRIELMYADIPSSRLLTSVLKNRRFRYRSTSLH